MSTSTQTELTLRIPTSGDAKAVWELIRRCEPLDPNSSYAYLLLCTHFAETCVVAELEGDVVGFVSGYVQPNSPKTLFIWQVAVDTRARGMGLGRGMLLDILLREQCKGVTHLETTVSPSNEASRRMFQGVADRMRTELNEKAFFSGELMAEDGHEDENLVTIGPFKPIESRG